MTARQLLLLLDRLTREQERLEALRARVVAGLVEHVPDARELAVLSLRAGALAGPRSIGSTAELLGVSKTRAAQLEARARERLEAKAAEAKDRRRPAPKRTPAWSAAEHELLLAKAALARLRSGPAPSASARAERHRRRQRAEARLRAARKAFRAAK